MSEQNGKKSPASATVGELFPGITSPKDELVRGQGGVSAAELERLAAMGVEPDIMPNLYLAAVIAVVTAVTVLAVVGVWQFFIKTTMAEQQAVQSASVNPIWVETRARDQQRLTTHDVTDAARGFYRIPIDKGIAKLLRDKNLVYPLLSGRPVPEPAATAAALTTPGTAQAMAVPSTAAAAQTPGSAPAQSAPAP